MKKSNSMKKLNKIKNKILMLTLAVACPLSATAGLFAVDQPLVVSAKANSALPNYKTSYISEVSLSNNNFSSGVSSSSLNSVNNWTHGNFTPATTSGVISTGSTFQTNMLDTYHLSKNPGSKASDNYVLMINSVTDNENTKVPARQNYSSSNVSLEANSFYSFQVAFKSMPTFVSNPTYTESGVISENDGFTIQESTFKSKAFGKYILVRYHSSNIYVLKALAQQQIQINFEDVELQEGKTQKEKVLDTFYEDDEYIGVVQEGKYLFVPVEYTHRTTDNTASQITLYEGAYGFECPNFVFTQSSGIVNYKIAKDTPYYYEEQNYTPENIVTKGSIYLDGLKDENGELLKATQTPKFEGISSSEWQVFSFFVATGNQSQSISLDLWLGSKGLPSGGVVFFDDVHIFRYSENAFWDICSKQIGSSYKQNYVDSNQNVLYSKDVKTTQLVDLREKPAVLEDTDNFTFETAPSNNNPVPLWDVSGTGSAKVFKVSAPSDFRSATENNFVGNDLSVNDVEITYDEENQIASIKPKYNEGVLGIYNKSEGFTTVTSKKIVDIDANKVYKISAKYKISDIESGNAYMFVQEYDDEHSIIKEKYGLKEYEFKPLAQSSAISSNNSNSYQNDYGTVEFYVKGGIYYNSSIKFGFQLGTEESLAKGCIVFDNVKIEESTTEAYNNASNKYALGDSAKTNSDFDINPTFDSVTSDGTGNLLSPENWTLTNGGKTGTIGGVVSTDEQQFSNAKKQYQTLADKGTPDSENPYYWTKYSNPGDKNNLKSSNKLMLANSHPDWQNAKSNTFKINAGEENKVYRLSFDFLTHSQQGFTISLYGEDGFKLYESKALKSDTWSTHTIYLKSLQEGANNVYLEIDFGTKADSDNSLAEGVIYVDNFKLENGNYTVPETATVVEMTDLYFNLPTNNITDDPETSTTPAYEGISSEKQDDMHGAVIKGNSSKFAEGSNLYLSDEFTKDKDGNYKNIFYIESMNRGIYTLQSKFNIDLENDYYALTFKVKTAFDTSKLKSGDFDYGATVGLTGFDYATKIRTDSTEPQAYTIYFHPSEATTAKLYITLNCNAETDGNSVFSGEMAVFDVVLHKTTMKSGDEYEGENEGENIEDLYSEATKTVEGKDYDINKDKVYVSTLSNTENDSDSTDTDTETSASGNGFNWLLIPTLITALAIVIAVVGWLLRKVKIKKIEKKRIETYDRDKSLHVDAIKNEAKAERDAEVKQTTDTINTFKAELARLETEHKQKVLALRDQDKDKVSKNTDKEFKLFAKKRTVLAEKIDNLNKELAELKSPEHLLTLERKAYLKQEAKRRELEKASKKESKNAEQTAATNKDKIEEKPKTKRNKK